MQEDKELGRPDTSKMSRSSNRGSLLNTTTKGFQSKQQKTAQRHIDSKSSAKRDTRDTFYQSKAKRNRSNPMSATFCDQAKSKQQKLKQKVKKANNTDSTKFLSDTIQPKHRTEMTEPTPNEKMFSSTGFTLNTGELKQGLTLDKVLGGGFKRIDIFSNPTNDFNEFEAPELLPQHILDDKINDLSDPEEDARYKSFEIVETENEEEANGDSPQKNQAKTIKGNTKKPKYESEPQDEERDQDIRERINRKYRHKPNRTYYKPTRKSSRSPESFSTNDNPSFKEDEGNENLEERGRANMQPKPSGSQHRKQEIRAFIAKNLREIDANRNCHSTKGTESRSVSPESLGGSRQSRFQNTFFQGSKNKTKDGFNNSTKQYSLTRQTFHKDSKNENTSPFETSFNGFNKGRGREKERLTSLDKKQGFAQSYGLDPDRGQHYKTYSTFNGDDDKQRSSGSKFFGSKSNLRAYELKNPKEHNQIADRIKQHENAMLEKYSNKKLVEQHERHSRYEDRNVAREGSHRRLSTPIRNMDPMNMTFNRKKSHTKH